MAALGPHPHEHIQSQLLTKTHFQIPSTYELRVKFPAHGFLEDT